MVVDDIEMDGNNQRRRYLVYDCMMLAGEGISDLRFEVGHDLQMLFCCCLLLPAASNCIMLYRIKSLVHVCLISAYVCFAGGADLSLDLLCCLV
jgi:hypothetical protein